MAEKDERVVDMSEINTYFPSLTSADFARIDIYHAKLKDNMTYIQRNSSVQSSLPVQQFSLTYRVAHGGGMGVVDNLYRPFPA